MIARRLTTLLLTLSLSLALPLAIQAYLLGGHVTPEQGLRHLASVAWQGVHVHAGVAGVDHEHDHLTATTAATSAPTAAPVTDAGPDLTNSAPLPFGSAWLAIAALALALLPLAHWRLGRRPAAARPPDHRPAIVLLPPRSPRPTPLAG
jgi:hypothetical protein